MELMIGMNNNGFIEIEEKFCAMGTDVSIVMVFADDVEMRSKARNVAEQVKNIFVENESFFSRFNPDSELSRINANVGKKTEISSKMSEVLSLCLKFHVLSDGYFDPRVLENLERIGYDKDFKIHDLNRKENVEINLSKIEGDLAADLVLEKNSVMLKTRIDTTGIAKGYTVDEAADFLDNAGWANFIIDAGGDMQARGLDLEGGRWRIGVEGMEDGRLNLGLDNEGIATSGISRKRWVVGDRKFHHLVNPKDPGNFSHDIKTVTVIDKKTVEADGRAKVLVLMGREKGMAFADSNNIKALFLDYRGNVYLSKAIKGNIINA